jgi:hypothetical protein
MMQAHKAIILQYVLVHTISSFYKINNLGGILIWNEDNEQWEETNSLSESDAKDIVAASLAKFDKPQFRH